MEQSVWELLSPDEKKKNLYLRQLDVLDKFLSRNAISKEQYNKSLSDLTEKMGMQEEYQKIKSNNSAT